MISRLTSLTIPRRIAVPLRIAAVLFTVLQLISLTAYGIAHGLAFIDGRIYLRGIEMFRAGLDPYVHFRENNFVYTPSFLRVGVWLMAHLSRRTLCVGYLALHFAAVMALPVVIARYYAKASWLKPDIAFVLFFLWPAFGSAFLMTANIASLLYSVILLAGIPGLRCGRWTAFYVAVAACAILKPPMLLFLLLPLLLSRRPWLPTSFAVVAWLAENFFESRWWPEEHAAYLRSAHHQVFGLRDLGYGVMHYTEKVGALLRFDGDLPGRILYAGVSVAVILGLWRARREPDGDAQSPLRVATILLAIMVLQPRPMKYDLPVALLPALVLCVPMFQALKREVGTRTCLLVPMGFLVLQMRACLFASLTLFLCVTFYALRAAVPRTSSVAEDTREQDTFGLVMS